MAQRLVQGQAGLIAQLVTGRRVSEGRIADHRSDPELFAGDVEDRAGDAAGQAQEAVAAHGHGRLRHENQEPGVAPCGVLFQDVGVVGEEFLERLGQGLLGLAAETAPQLGSSATLTAASVPGRAAMVER